MKGPDLGPAKFTCYLRGKLANHEPRSITVLRVAKSKQDDAEHAHLDLVPIEEAVPGAGMCFLQLWEADHFASYYTTIGESPKSIRANRLVGSIPGAIVAHGSGYRFVVLGAPQHTHPTEERNGSVTLTLLSASGETQAIELHLPDYEGVLELFAVIKLTSTTPALANFEHGKPHQVHNIRATLLRQIEHRGGVHVAIVSDYGFETTNSNNKEFRRQADSMVAQLPSIIVQDGAIAFGRYEVANSEFIKDRLQEVRDACQGFLGLPTGPLVGSLAIYAHGIPSGLQMGNNKFGDAVSLNIKNVDTFVRDNRPHLAPTLIVALFACNSARGGGMSKDFKALRGKSRRWLFSVGSLSTRSSAGSRTPGASRVR